MRKASNLNHERDLLIFFTFLAVGFYAIYIFRTSFELAGERYFTLIDDAMISMRYAKHFAGGHGLVWNIGQPPVQGFTNLTWTLVMSAVHLVSLPDSKTPLLVSLISGLILVVNAFLVRGIGRRLDKAASLGPNLALFASLFYYPVVHWSLRGMEVGLIVLLFSLILYLLFSQTKPLELKPALILAGLLVLVVSVRIDAILQAVVVLAHLLWDQRRDWSGSKNALLVLVVFLAGFAAVLLFQKLYFGYWFPNTFYLKISGSNIVERINVGVQTLVFNSARDFLPPLLIVIVGIFFLKGMRRNEVLLLLGMFLIQVFYAIYVGGDYVEAPLDRSVQGANRFVAQGMLPLIVLACMVIDQFIQAVGQSDLRIALPQGMKLTRPVFATLLIGFVFVGVLSGVGWFDWMIYNAEGLPFDIEKARIGVHILNNSDTEAVVAAHAAGQIPYFSNRGIIDLLGKSDAVIAHGVEAEGVVFQPGHTKWNYAYSIGQLQPDIIADTSWYLDDFLIAHPEYQELENGIWIRRDSTLIDVEGLSSEIEN